MTQRRRAFILVAGAGLALALLYFSKPLSLIFSEADNDGPTPSQLSVGHLEKIQGKVYSKQAGAWEYQPLATPADQPIYNLQAILLDRQSSAVAKTHSGYEILFQSQSEFVFELWNPDDENSPVYLNMISGDYELVRSGDLGKLYIVKEGRLLRPNHKQAQSVKILTIRQPKEPSLKTDIPLPKTQSEIEPSIAPPSPPVSAKAEGKLSREGLPETIGNRHIEQVIASKKHLFQKCQAKSLRKQSEVKGRILIGLKILPSGKVDDVRVLQSSLEDKQMEGCITTVFERSKFMPFTGAEVAFSYPLVFE